MPQTATPNQFVVVAIYKDTDIGFESTKIFGPYNTNEARVAARYINETFKYDDTDTMHREDLTPKQGCEFVQAVMRPLEHLSRFDG